MQLFKLTLVFGLVAVAAAGYIHGHEGSSYATVVKHDAPQHHGHYDDGHHDDGQYHGDAVIVEAYGHHEHDDHQDYPDSHPAYKFEYGVKDAHTGDNKNQWEHRDGDKVKGAYELHEADGTKRVVEYTADDHNGFNAVVKRVGHAQHPQVYGHQDGHVISHEHGNGHHDGHVISHEHGHGHGHAESFANSNLYDHHH